MEVEEREDRAKDVEPVPDPKQIEAEAATPSVSASSSRSSSTSSSSSSSGRTSKKWIFLKDLLYRSKSEGRERGNTKEKFWHLISFSQSKSKSKPPPSTPPPSASATTADSTSSANLPSATAISGAEKAKSKDPSPPVGWSTKRTAAKPVNGLGRRMGPAPSPHERHHTANRAQAEEMRRKVEKIERKMWSRFQIRSKSRRRRLLHPSWLRPLGPPPRPPLDRATPRA